MPDNQNHLKNSGSLILMIPNIVENYTIGILNIVLDTRFILTCYMMNLMISTNPFLHFNYSSGFLCEDSGLDFAVSGAFKTECPNVGTIHEEKRLTYWHCAPIRAL